MADDPNIVVAPSGDGRYVAVMHLFDKVRTIFGRDLPHLAQQMRSAAIAEFGVMQEDAGHLVDGAMKHFAASEEPAPPPPETATEPEPAKEA